MCYVQLRQANVGGARSQCRRNYCTNIHLNFRHFPRSNTSAASQFCFPSRWCFISNALRARRMLHCAHSLPHHTHNHRIEVIKLVIVFFVSLVWPSSAWDILWEDARFSFFSHHHGVSGRKHQWTFPRLEVLLNFSGESSSIHRFNNLRIATQKNISYFRSFLGFACGQSPRKIVIGVRFEIAAPRIFLDILQGANCVSFSNPSGKFHKRIKRPSNMCPWHEPRLS